jgi:hypothetical protein
MAAGLAAGTASAGDEVSAAAGYGQPPQNIFEVCRALKPATAAAGATAAAAVAAMAGADSGPPPPLQLLVPPPVADARPERKKTGDEGELSLLVHASAVLAKYRLTIGMHHAMIPVVDVNAGKNTISDDASGQSLVVQLNNAFVDADGNRAEGGEHYDLHFKTTDNHHGTTEVKATKVEGLAKHFPTTVQQWRICREFRGDAMLVRVYLHADGVPTQIIVLQDPVGMISDGLLRASSHVHSAGAVYKLTTDGLNALEQCEKKLSLSTVDGVNDATVQIVSSLRHNPMPWTYLTQDIIAIRTRLVIIHDNLPLVVTEALLARAGQVGPQTGFAQLVNSPACLNSATVSAVGEGGQGVSKLILAASKSKMTSLSLEPVVFLRRLSTQSCVSSREPSTACRLLGTLLAARACLYLRFSL